MGLYVSAGVSGIALGLLYGLIGFAIVMLYKATGVANFAQGSLGTLGAFVCLRFMRNFHMPLGYAIALSMVISAVLGVACFLIVIRPRSEAGNLNITVRTLGLSLVVVAVITKYWGPGSPYKFPAIIGGTAFTVASVVVSNQQLLIAVVTLVIVTLFWVLFQYTRTGLSLRALAEQPDIARLLGLRASRLSALVWAISCILGTSVGILLAPTSFLEPTTMDPYLLYTFTGIVLGGLTSLPGALLGSVVVGIVGNVMSIAFSPEIGVVVIFGLLLASMLLRPNGLLGKAQVARL